MRKTLPDLLRDAVLAAPEKTAVVDARTSLTYAGLDRRADVIARALAKVGVGKGDRVGLWCDKSVDVVAAMQGCLRLGAAYVPLDPFCPTARIRTILSNCAVAALVADDHRASQVLVGHLAATPRLALGELRDRSADPLPAPPIGEKDLAYILYTSGSSGVPKGVAIGHGSALAFVEWAASELRASADDRFANHAPFHFDLSVLDLYVAFAAHASVHLVPDAASFAPRGLVDFVASREITVWYSVPSALVMMMDSGGLLELSRCSVRAFCFAGEPFPARHLQRLVAWRPPPLARYLNLYGPTETNVCTFHEVRPADLGAGKPPPIGRACCGDRVWAETKSGGVAAVGEEGELVVDGPTAMLGYWGAAPRGDAPYRTGDLVRRLDEEGTYEYVGRLDAMVKVRGHRVELGDVEAALGEHPSVHEAAVVVAGEGLDARLVAFVVARREHEVPPLLDVKRHCAERLPRYMIVDHLVAVDALPRTRNGKVDRRRLANEAGRTRCR